MRRCIVVGFLSCFGLTLAGLDGATSAAAPKPLTRGDLRWLNRVTFGINSDVVARR